MKQNNIAGMFTVFIGRARANGFVQQQYLNLLANPVFIKMFTQHQTMALIKIQHTLQVTAMAATLRRQHNVIL